MMGVFESVEKIKEYLKYEFYSNQNLLKLIKYPSSNPLLESDVEDVYELNNKYIFFESKSTQFEEEAKTFVFISTRREESKYVDFDNIDIIFDIMCHEDIEVLGNDTNRIYQIMNYIDDILKKSNNNLGIGRIKLKSSGIPISSHNNFTGKRFRYSFSDFSSRIR